MTNATLLHRLAAGWITLLATTAAQAAGWTLTELPSLGGAVSVADAINASGRVSGYADAADGTPYPVLWVGGQAVRLAPRPGRALVLSPAGVAAGNALSEDGQRLEATLMVAGQAWGLGTLGGSFSNVAGVNDRGQVVGYARTADEKDHAFLATAAGMQDLGTYGGLYSYAYGINQAGLVVGAAYDAAGSSRCFLSTGAGLVDPGTLGGSFCAARAVNDAGQVTGSSTTANGQGRAFLFDGQRMLDLGTLGGTSSGGVAINRHGQVVGASRTANGQMHAFLHDGARMLDLGTLGGTTSAATGVNALGQVVGYATLPNGQRQPFLYADGVMLNVNTLVPELTNVDFNRLSLNDSGQLAGTGSIRGVPGAFVLTRLP